MCPHQVVNGVVWFHFADLNESLCEGGHHMPHEVVAEGYGLCVQHLLLLLLYLRELSILEKRGGITLFSVAQLLRRENLLTHSASLCALRALSSAMCLSLSSLSRVSLLNYVQIWTHVLQYNMYALSLVPKP